MVLKKHKKILLGHIWQSSPRDICITILVNMVPCLLFAFSFVHVHKIYENSIRSEYAGP